VGEIPVLGFRYFGVQEGFSLGTKISLTFYSGLLFGIDGNDAIVISVAWNCLCSRVCFFERGVSMLMVCSIGCWYLGLRDCGGVCVRGY